MKTKRVLRIVLLLIATFLLGLVTGVRCCASPQTAPATTGAPETATPTMGPAATAVPTAEPMITPASTAAPESEEERELPIDVPKTAAPTMNRPDAVTTHAPTAAPVTTAPEPSASPEPTAAPEPTASHEPTSATTPSQGSNETEILP